MAILLTMIATIFMRATSSFRMARASVEIHQNARTILNSLTEDLTAAEFCNYVQGAGNARGHFSLTFDSTVPPAGPTPPPTPWVGHVDGASARNSATALARDTLVGPWPAGGLTGAYVYITGGTNVGQARRIVDNDADAVTVTPPWNGGTPPDGSTTYTIGFPMLTFTTLAPQPGARYAAPESVQQLALVRYALEWDGGAAKINNISRPTFHLIKRVRFPRLDDPGLNMNIFDANDTEIKNWEIDPADLNAGNYDGPYSAPEPTAFALLSMNVRAYFGLKGTASAGGLDYLDDAGKFLSVVPQAPLTGQSLPLIGRAVEIIAVGPAQSQSIVSTGADTRLGAVANWAGGPALPGWQYRVPAGWYELAASANPLPWLSLIRRPPAMVEVTFEMTDLRATRTFTFTQRFYIPASERFDE